MTTADCGRARALTARVGRTTGARRVRVIARTGVVVIATLIGMLFVEALAADSVARRRHVVEIRGFEYEPAALRVMAGDTVVWVNHDVVPHTATASGGGWDTGKLAANATATVVASGIGEQTYVCAYHPSMKAKLVVEPGAGAAHGSRSGEGS